MPARKPQSKAPNQKFFGIQQPPPQQSTPTFCFRVLQSQLFEEDEDDCSFWPSDSLMASVVQAFDSEEEEEDLLRRMTSLSLAMALGSRSRTSNAIDFKTKKKDRGKKKENETSNLFRANSCRKAQLGRAMRDLNIPFSFSERRLREIQNFTRYATKIAQRNRQRKFPGSSKDLVVSSSPLARIGSERRDDDDTEGSIEIIDGGEKVKLRRCLSVPQLDHLTSIPFEDGFFSTTQEIDMLPEIEEA